MPTKFQFQFCSMPTIEKTSVGLTEPESRHIVCAILDIVFEKARDSIWERSVRVNVVVTMPAYQSMLQWLKLSGIRGQEWSLRDLRM